MKSIIVYATKYGCTKKAANILKSKLSGDVQMVNALKDTVPPLNQFDNIIFGGSIYMGKIQKELISCITTNLELLQSKKLGLFICAASPDLEARKRELESAFPAEVFNHATVKALFGYEFNFEKMNFMDKMITKAIKGDKNNASEIDENNISEFAKAMM